MGRKRVVVAGDHRHAVAPAARDGGRARALASLLVFLAGCVVYLGTLRADFVFDDRELLARAADFVTNWRPVKRLTIVADHALHGENPAGYHLTNALLHGLASLVLYRVAAGALAGAAGAGLGALACGLVFAVHPAHVEAVAAIAHRKESLALLFSGLALLAARRVAWGRARWGAVLAAYALALGSKEVAGVMVPALALIDASLRGERVVRRPFGPIAQRVGLATLAIGLGAMVWLQDFTQYFGAAHLARLSEGRTEAYADFARTALATIPFYSGLFVWPHPLYLDRAFPLATTFADPRVLGGVLLLAALVAAAWFAARRGVRGRALAFGLLWFLITLVPIANVIPLSHWLVAERFFYMPSAGLALAVGAFFAVDGGPFRTMARLALVAITVALGARTVVETAAWRDDLAIAERTLRYNPASYRAHRARGDAYLARGAAAEAEAAYRAALALRPGSASTEFGLARALLASGRAAEAIAPARASAARTPMRPAPWLALGEALAATDDLAGAGAAYERALALDPASRAARYGRAAVDAEAGRLEAAREGTLALLARDPADAPAAALLGVVALRLGKTDEAETALRRALAIDPGSAATHRHLAALLIQRGGALAEVRSHLEAARRIDPSSPDPEALLRALGAAGHQAP